VRDRGNENRRAQSRGPAPAAFLRSQLLLRVMQRPVDSFAILGAAAATLVIIVNAVFLQAGAPPAPFVAAPAQPAVAADTQAKAIMQGTLKPADLAPARTISAQRQQQMASVPLPSPAPARRNDPIADLIGPSPRIAAVQRVLSEYGYGQIKPTGTLDTATSEAIEKFERDHKLALSGRVSDKLVNELGNMTGHPVE
jgi:putative peptidoglycan binding protein